MSARAGFSKVAAAAACCCVALAASGCKKKEKTDATPSQPAARPTAPAAPPQVTLSRRVERARSKGYLGEVIAERTVRIASKIRGRVLRMRKDVGDKVRRGELLAVIDSLDTSRQLDEAKAAVLTGKAQIVQAMAQLARAERELQRKRPLFKKDLVTKQDMDNVQSMVELARAGLGLAKARLGQAEARVRTLKTTIGHTRVRAPFAGRVSGRLVEPGTIVTDINPTPIYEVVTAHKLLVRFKVPERDIRGFPEKKRVHLRVAAYPGKRFEAKIVRIYPRIDAASRSAVVEGRIVDPKGNLKAGMFARVEVTWPKEAKTVVPRRALAQRGSRSGVYVKEGNGVRFIPVVRGDPVDGDVEVHGLRAGLTLYLGKPPAAAISRAKSPGPLKSTPAPRKSTAAKTAKKKSAPGAGKLQGKGATKGRAP